MAETKTLTRYSFYFTNKEAVSFNLEEGEVVHTYPEGWLLQSKDWSAEILKAQVCYMRKATVTVVEYTDAEQQVRQAGRAAAAAEDEYGFR